jgi:molybdenum cofactor cytidylyltransferase
MTAYADIAVALLAAGQGIRFGSDKLLAEIDGEPLGLKAAKTLMEFPFGRHFAVCKSDGALAEQLADHGFMVVANDQPEQGQAHSLHLAVKAAMTTEAKALLVTLADMPFVSTAHLTALIFAYDGRITASTDGQSSMPPAIFPRESWPGLLATSGDAGARVLLKSAAVVRCAEGELRDIDTLADLTASK